MRARRAVGLATWVGLVAAVIAALTVCGRGALATPSLGSARGWTAWLAHTDPLVVAFASVRLLALGAAWYALAVTVLGALGRLSGAGALAAAAERLTVPLLRRVLATSLSVGIVGGGIGAMAGPAGAQAGAQGADPPPTIVMHRLGDEAPPEIAPGLAPPAPRPAPAAPARDPISPAPEQWQVAPGQCFWSIAHDVLGAAWHRAPSDAEIVPYWRRLIEANRGALADRDNPDLIFPGQVFTVPAP